MTIPYLDSPIEYLKGVGPKRAELLRKEINIGTFGQLLEYYPFRYIDRSKIDKIIDISSESQTIQLKGTITDLQTTGKGRSVRLTATLRDDSGSLELVWFQGIKWVKEKIKPSTAYLVFGKPSVFNGKINIVHPEIELVSEQTEADLQGYKPVYSSTEPLKTHGLDSRGITKLMHVLLENSKGKIPETIPSHILTETKLPNKELAINNIHFPLTPEYAKWAEARLKFEELLFLQLEIVGHKLARKQNSKGQVFSKIGAYVNQFYQQKLPFELTNAQKRVIKEIRSDLGSGKQMNRLLQGDVGSGKTLVALMVMLIALDNGFQACLMAPTEILANQHFNTIKRLLDGLGISIELLTGSTPNSQRKTLLANLLNGELQLLIGTHALIEDTVQFGNLGLVVIDEQHRFGVEQRAKLWKKNTVPPHILVMTATPIPRTLAMTLYGDLDYSVIDEMPPGRKEIKTFHFTDSSRLKVFGFMRQQIKSGRQIYIVYPLINESESLDLKDLMDGFEAISRDFPLPEYAVSMVHGQLKSAEKDYEMQRFIKGETQIMVSTTVIEVGVDVPNASVMVIESAERFGLSQLHQLRGRVGRGAEQSYCILMSKDQLSNEARKRIQIMVESNDGFEISDADLKLRGPGDIQGTRQSGMVELKIADLSKDDKILAIARGYALRILAEDHNLQQPKHQILAFQLQKNAQQRRHWSMIS
jgi:ATP-dependent DNA helicase RecG